MTVKKRIYTDCLNFPFLFFDALLLPGIKKFRYFSTMPGTYKLIEITPNPG